MVSQGKALMIVLVGVILTAVPIVYSIGQGAKASYWNGVMSNWLATVAGIMVGVPFALWISRLQQRTTEVEQAKRDSEQRDQVLRVLGHRIHAELQYNLVSLNHLSEVLDKTNGIARVDHWAWIKTIVDSFEFDAQGDFERSALVPHERLVYFADIDMAYRELKRIYHRVYEASAAHDFHYGYAGNETEANWQLSTLGKHVGIAKAAVTSALERSIGSRG